MSLERVCTRQVDLVRAGESVHAAARRMHQRNVGSLVVVNDDDEPVGIVTDRDLVIRVLAAARDPGQTRVSEVMSAPPRTVTSDATVEEVLAIMREGAIRRVVVTRRSGALRGIVSLDDILRLLAEDVACVGQLLARETPRAL